MKINVTQVDAFTDKPFAGNPAAVCVLSESESVSLSDEVRQAIAAEMNLAETAFVVRSEGQVNLRWFTPKVEVDLCGHATLAAAHTLWSEGHVAWEQDISFQTRSGILTCSNQTNTATGRREIELNFPRLEYRQIAAPEGLLEALGIDAVCVVQSSMDILVEVANEDLLRGMSPDFGRLAKSDARGVIVTTRTPDGRYDFISRFFAPAAGIDEDPVTGSAHCLLAPYWKSKLGKSEFLAFQASPRGGELRVILDRSRVRLIGQAVTVMRGELSI